jgi:hypothetical protein
MASQTTKKKPTPAVPVSQLRGGAPKSVAGVKLASEPAARELLRGANQPKTRTVTFDAPAGAIDMNQLADLLVQRLQPQAAQSQSAGSGRILEAHVPEHAVGSFDRTMAAISSNQLGQSLPTKTPPVEAELNQMSVNLETVHQLISDLSNDLEPMLAHEEMCDKDATCMPTRSSESPLHRRLIDRNDTLEQIIGRLHHLKSRIRN